MAGVRKRHTVEFKAKVALEAIRQQKTSNQLTAEYGIHATQINTWKKQALAAIPEAFSGKRERAQETQQGQIDELHRQIGQLIAERDWLKKKSSAIHWGPGKCSSNPTTRLSASGNNAGCWASTVQACTTGRWLRARITWD